jgi:hypothetical protein
MNNGSLHIKSNNSRTTTKSGTDQSLIHNIDQNTSLDLTDVSILSVGVTHYQNHNHEMLTDDDEDNEVVGINKIIINKIILKYFVFRSKQVMKMKTMMMMMMMNHYLLIHVMHY